VNAPRSSHSPTVRSVITALQWGERLRLCFRNGSPHWALTSGVLVPDAVAKAVIARPDVIATDTGLFPDAPPQTWRLRPRS